MRDNSLFSPKKPESSLELSNDQQLLSHFFETAKFEVNKYFDINFEKIKKEVMAKGLSEPEALQVLKDAFQKALEEAEKIAREKYAKKISEKANIQSPSALS